jgi:hypothetical protein
VEMRRLSAACMALFVFTACGIAVAAPKPSPLPKTLCGITAGKSVDKDVVRRYGKGFFAPNEDHGGGRYFVDPGKRLTLHTTIGVDSIIYKVECNEGVKLPSKSTRSLRQATTARLAVPKLLAGKLRFGASINSVERQYGAPAGARAANRATVLIYTRHAKDDAFDYYVHFVFAHDKLVAVSIYNGE